MIDGEILGYNSEREELIKRRKKNYGGKIRGQREAKGQRDAYCHEKEKHQLIRSPEIDCKLIIILFTIPNKENKKFRKLSNK